MEEEIEVTIGERRFRHGVFDPAKCSEVHGGWDPHYSPFLDKESGRDNPPAYYRFLDHRFRHRGICGGRGCLRACLDHLEKTGRLTGDYHTPMVEGEQWTITEPLE